MFGEDESESPRLPSPWQVLSRSPPPSTSVPPSSFTRRASYLERMAIEACAQSGSGLLSQPMTRANSGRELTLSLEAEALRMEGQLWGGETLAPEVDDIGHIEYKLKLIAPTPSRRAKLTTQLQWRLLEGGGTALYEIGVLDDGALVGLSRAEMLESLTTLEAMAADIGAKASVSRVVEIPEIIVRAGPVHESPTSTTPSSRTATPSRGQTPPNRPAHLPPRPPVPIGRRRKAKGSPDHLRPPPGSGKPRINPGDAAVSSSSSGSEEDESNSAGEQGSSTDASAQGAATRSTSRSPDTSLDTFLDLGSLQDALPSHTNGKGRSSEHSDGRSTLTPAERSERRRQKRDANRAATALLRSNTPSDDGSSAQASRRSSSSSAKHGARRVIAPVEETETQEDPSGPRFVVEVVVQQQREQGQAFLDFEGFGLED